MYYWEDGIYADTSQKDGEVADAHVVLNISSETEKYRVGYDEEQLRANDERHPPGDAIGKPCRGYGTDGATSIRRCCLIH